VDERQILTTLGLSDYEAQVYAALIKLPRARVRDIAPMTEVPRPQVYTALKSLADKGMCMEYPGRINYYSAVPPAVVLTELLEKQKMHLKKITNEVQRLIERYQQTSKINLPETLLEVLKGNRLSQVLTEEIKLAQKQILIFVHEPTENSPDRLRTAIRLEQAVLKQGVRVRCLYDRSCVERPELLPYLRRLIQSGEEARTLTGVPMNMVLIDDRLGTFSLNHGTNETTVFAFRHSALVRLFIAAFEQFWQKGVPLTFENTKQKRR